jgi:hypothetical protein
MDNILITIIMLFITVSYIFGVIYWNQNPLYGLIFFPPVVSIYAVIWEKYRRCRDIRAIRDDEAVIGLMDEDEELDEGMNLYGVKLTEDEGLGLGK